MKNNADPTGITYLLRAIPMLFKPTLRVYIVAPILANLFLFLLLLWLGVETFQHFIDWSNSHPKWLHWLNWLFWILFALSYLVFFFFTFTLFACLIAAPFNGLLSEKAEIFMMEQTPETTSIADFLRDVPRVMKREGQKLLYFIPRALLLLVLFLIPGINLLAPFIWLAFSAWMMTIQYVDYPMDNHRIPFNEMRKTLRKHPLKNLGFGGSVMAFMLIPGLNLVILPSAVIAATLLWTETKHAKRNH